MVLLYTSKRSLLQFLIDSTNGQVGLKKLRRARPAKALPEMQKEEMTISCWTHGAISTVSKDDRGDELDL